MKKFLKSHGRTLLDLSLGAVIAAGMLWNADALGLASPATANGDPPPLECGNPCNCTDGTQAKCCGGTWYCPDGEVCSGGGGGGPV